MSLSTNLVAGDTNQLMDLFLRDRMAGSTVRVNVDSSGQQSVHAINEEPPTISDDGRFVAFSSTANDLVPGDTNNRSDVFLRDVIAARTTRVSVDSSGGETGDDNLGSCSPAISGDGRFVVFASNSSQLVPDDTNSSFDVFRHDSLTGVTIRVSVDATGNEGHGDSGYCAQPPDGSNRLGISENGRFVAFQSFAQEFAGLIVKDVEYGSTELVNQRAFRPSISSDGRFVAFESNSDSIVPADTNGVRDVFVRDRETGYIERVSVSSSGGQSNDFSGSPSVSGTGRFVSYTSNATNLVEGDMNGSLDVFVHDRLTHTTTLVGLTSTGVPISLGSSASTVSDDGQDIAFASYGRDVVPDPAAGYPAIFARHRPLVSISSVQPSVGSEAGGDVVHVFATGMTTATDTHVEIGSVAVNIVRVAPDSVTVRAPAGMGRADVSISNSVGISTRRSAYAYVAPLLAARYGNVNQDAGDREDVLLLNATAGDPVERRIVLRRDAGMTAVLLSPSSRMRSRFAIYVWPGIPNETTRRAQPRGVGLTVFPTPLDVGAEPQPVRILNNLDTRLGPSATTASLTPAILGNRPAGIARIGTVTLQGFIEDDASAIPRHVSVTNAVVLHVVP
ncbi:MAG: PD40 domain-containing protein [Planctomycetes bacterium]|nr:PD40 domain-containing protein [Planctomycetota bacterium]MBI3845359.1 PD40 domain-containing protein [Planctomycetota bacterium]